MSNHEASVIGFWWWKKAMSKNVRHQLWRYPVENQNNKLWAGVKLYKKPYSKWNSGGERCKTSSESDHHVYIIYIYN